MVKFGLGFTAYILLSFILFLAASNTISGGIVYLFLLLPLYGVVLLVAWIFIANNHTKIVQIKYKVLSRSLNFFAYSVMLSKASSKSMPSLVFVGLESC